MANFQVTIDDHVWAKVLKRLAEQGMTGDAAEILGALIATSLTDAPPRPVGDATISTTLMVTLGKVKVTKLPECRID